MLRKRWQTHILIIGVYALLALVLTWPLVLHFGNHVPGNGVDDPPLTWNLWWIRSALLEFGTNPFDCDFLFYPLGINLAFYTLTLLNGLLSLPVQAIWGLIPASNLLLLSSFVLGGYGAFLLALHLLDGPASDRGSSRVFRLLPPFAAGLLYAFSASKLSYAALGQWNIASSQWIPFYVLYLLKIGDSPRRWRYTFMAALFLLFQAYAEMTYATFLVLFTALWLVWVLVRASWARLAVRRIQETGTPETLSAGGAGKSRDLGWLFLSLVSLVCLFVIALAPVLVMMLPELLAEGDILVQGGGFADVFSADLLGFLVPTMYHPVFGSLVERFHFDYSVGQHIYLGYSVLVLALLAVVLCRHRQTSPESPSQSGGNAMPPSSKVRFWLLATGFFWLLALGPTLRINGQDTGLPLPFAWVARLPFFQGNRYPSRYSVMLFLSLAMLIALGLAALLRRTQIQRSLLSSLSSLLLVSILLFEHLSIPLPLSDMGVPPVYQMIADEMPGDFTLLDLPVAWRNGFRVTGTQNPIIMFQQYWQSVHGKRLLAGNTSRNPPLKFQYFTEAPLINTLIALETGHQIDGTILEQDSALAPQVLRFFNIRTILVHPAQTGPDMVPYVEATMPVERWFEDGDSVAYRVNLPPWPETWDIEPGDALGHLSFAEGWGVPATGAIWAQRRSARLLVPLNGERQQMTFRAYVPEGGQRLEVEVNGQTVSRVELVAGWMDHEVVLPSEAVQGGLNEIWLHFGTLFPASSVRLAPRTIGSTGVESPLNLVVSSAGQEVGDLGHIYVDGRDLSPGRRGYNVAVIDPVAGTVVATASFDTHLDEGASQALADFLVGIPEGHIVALAAKDEASRLLGNEAVTAILGIGAAGDLRERFRWGHAVIGVQGAVPGTAAEAMDWMRPVTVTAGEGATGPNLAAAFGAISFKSIPVP